MDGPKGRSAVDEGICCGDVSDRPSHLGGPLPT